MQALLPALLNHGGAFVFTVILATRLGLPLPATPIILLAGALVVQGPGSAIAIVTASAAANLLGDSMWFAAGRKWGLRVMRLLCKVSLSPSSCVGRSEDLMLRWGGISLIAGKFVPGVSLVAPPMAGALGMKAHAFAGFSVVSGLAWSAALAGTGYILREQIDRVLAALTHLSLIAVAAAVAVFALLSLRHLRSRRSAAIPRITPDELRDDRRNAGPNGRPPLVIDVRSRSAAALDPRRVDGSVHVPLRELSARVQEFDSFDSLVVYCDCPEDASAVSAAQIVMARGNRDVRVLDGGLDGWFAPARMPSAWIREARP